MHVCELTRVPPAAPKTTKPPAAAAAGGGGGGAARDSPADVYDFEADEPARKKTRTPPAAKPDQVEEVDEVDDEEDEVEEVDEDEEDEDGDRAASKKFFKSNGSDKHKHSKHKHTAARARERTVGAARARIRWSADETEALVEGVRLLGASGKWAEILTRFRHVFVQRLPGDLKDKWRNLCKHAPPPARAPLDLVPAASKK